jgi:hypothetical protein
MSFNPLTLTAADLSPSGGTEFSFMISVRLQMTLFKPSVGNQSDGLSDILA